MQSGGTLIIPESSSLKWFVFGAKGDVKIYGQINGKGKTKAQGATIGAFSLPNGENISTYSITQRSGGAGGAAGEAGVSRLYSFSLK